MNTYAFLLGAHPTLSLAELLSFLDNNKIKYGEFNWLGEILIIKIQQSPDKIAELQNILGGVIKIFIIHKEFKGKIFKLEEILTTDLLIKDFFAQKKNKINFGISVYAYPEPSNAELNWLRNFAYNIKRKLKNDYSIRYVEDKGWTLSSVQVERNRLIDTGAEIALIKHEDTYYVGKTLTVQDYRFYSKRDWDKPSPDPKSGMLPPKLAQMMINLARDKKNLNIYDPFCGSGVILQEALLLGLKIYGSDISKEAIKNTIENLAWFIKLKKLDEIKLNSRIKEYDATSAQWVAPNKIATIIVTEPYLGPPLKSIPFDYQIKNTLKELADLYIKFFINLNKNFNNIKKVAIVFPVIKTRNGLKYLDIIKDIESIGYKRKMALPKSISLKDAGISPRGGFLYSRPNQFVLREIFIFEK